MRDAQTYMKGNWYELKGNVQKQWGKLTESDISEINGDTNILIGKVMKAYSKSKDDAQKEVDRFCQEIESKKGNTPRS